MSRFALDALHAEEWHPSRTRNPGTGRVLSRYNQYGGANPADMTPEALAALRPDSAYVSLADQTNPLLSSSMRHRETSAGPDDSCSPGPTGDAYWIYVSQRERERVARQRGGASVTADVTVLCGAHYEMTWHGLRTYFQQENRVLVTVPGREANWCTPSKVWGIGISQTILRRLFTAAGLAGVEPRVTILAGYSAGWRGVNGILYNHDRLGIDLRHVRQVVLFDCLYIGTGAGHLRTVDAFRTLVAQNPSARVVLYDATEGGAPTASAPVLTMLRRTFGQRFTHHNLKVRGRADERFIALVAARALATATTDGVYIRRDALEGPVSDLIAALPPRGGIATDQASMGDLPGFVFTRWASDNAALFRRADYRVIQRAVTRHIKPRRLLGYDPPSRQELAHYGTLSEYGWQSLL